MGYIYIYNDVLQEEKPNFYLKYFKKKFGDLRKVKAPIF